MVFRGPASGGLLVLTNGWGVTVGDLFGVIFLFFIVPTFKRLKCDAAGLFQFASGLVPGVDHRGGANPGNRYNVRRIAVLKGPRSQGPIVRGFLRIRLFHGFESFNFSSKAPNLAEFWKTKTVAVSSPAD